MIVRAVRGGFVPHLPAPVRWVGWYEAIEDILHTLPDSQFAPWQLERLPEELRTEFLFMTEHHKHSEQGREGRGGNNTAAAPSNTVLPSSLGGDKAFLIGKNQDKYGDGIRYAVEPAQTIGANEHGSKAFIVDCQKAGDPTGERNLTIRSGEDPMFTLTGSMGVKRPTRAFTGCRIVAMTPRALARFQSIPDWVVLPESKTLAAKVIGNAVPPLVMEKVYKDLRDCL
jgi:DNA (cytosine-5)-methyltransferase 1